MSVKPDSSQKPSPVLGPDVPALNAGFYHRLANGSIKELVRAFGLGELVARTLKQLGCRSGPDVVKLKLACVFDVAGAGGVTCRKIVLLKQYLKLRKRIEASDGRTN